MEELFEGGERGERRERREESVCVGCLREEREETHTTHTAHICHPHTQSEQTTHYSSIPPTHNTYTTQHTSPLSRGPCTGSAAPLLPPPKQPTHTLCVDVRCVCGVCVCGVWCVGVLCGCLCVCVVARGLFVAAGGQEGRLLRERYVRTKQPPAFQDQVPPC